MIQVLLQHINACWWLLELVSCTKVGPDEVQSPEGIAAQVTAWTGGMAM